MMKHSIVFYKNSKCFTIILICLMCSGSTLAQNYFTGYVILNSGDTLRGKIAPYDESSNGMYRNVRFEKDDYKTRFSPEEITAYKVLSYEYVTADIGNGETNLVFLSVVVSGYCSLYKYKDEYNSPSLPGTLPDYRNTERLYLQKGDEPFHKVNYSQMALGRDLYFLDNPSLTYDIQNKEYRYKDLEEIVKRYNRERDEKNK